MEMIQLKIAIRYYTKSGNTKKIAEAISEASGAEALSIEEPIKDEVDILFLGSSVYGAEVDEKVKKFISSLDSKKVKKVVNFSTAAILPSTYNQVSKLLSKQNIPIEKSEFHCRGKFKFLHKEHPNREDLEKAKKFAENIIKQG